ncbi:MAG: tRNA lysidine(34) synthetase TilS [Dehalococcoidia bacterium]|nr:tRNA lysidine(34) synthetase TilS [Dehalococcoidia bacterium]
MSGKSGRIETPLERRVLSYARRHGLLPAGGALVVGVSGGPDSICLLHILTQAGDRLGVDLHAAHLNHGLRGSDAEDDAEYVTRLCHRLGVPAIIERRDVAVGRRKHSPLEEAAREARYSFFGRVTSSADAEAVAVGHTVDDHLETILMHLIRGAGTRGLRGLEPKSTWRSDRTEVEVVRPLLEVGHGETVEYCRHFDLRPRQDTSNHSPALLRNRIRHELMPLLKGYNPAFSRALQRTASIAGEDLQALEMWAAHLWDDIAHQKAEGLSLDKEKLRSHPPGLQRILLRRALETVRDSPRDIESDHIEAMLGAIHMSAGKSLSLLGGVVLSVGYDCLMLSEGRPPPFPPLEEEHPLEVPGETRIPGWLVLAEVMEESGTAREQLGDPLTAHLDLDRSGLPLVVRCRCPGDRFQPLGMAQSKKLQDYMVDARIPRARRDDVPLVCSPYHILWVVGWRLDERVKVTDRTKRILRLLFRQVS